MRLVTAQPRLSVSRLDLDPEPGSAESRPAAFFSRGSHQTRGPGLALSLFIRGFKLDLRDCVK